MEQVDDKPREEFLLFDALNRLIGHGTYYPYGGNVQVYLKAANYASHQYASLAEALLIPEVQGFRWKEERGQDGNNS